MLRFDIVDITIRDTVVSGPAVDSASAVGPVGHSLKRQRPDSVVTKPQIPSAKRASVAPRTADWLLGKLGNPAPNRGRGRGMASAGGQPGIRGNAALDTAMDILLDDREVDGTEDGTVGVMLGEDIRSPGWPPHN